MTSSTIHWLASTLRRTGRSIKTGAVLVLCTRLHLELVFISWRSSDKLASVVPPTDT